MTPPSLLKAGSPTFFAVVRDVWCRPMSSAAVRRRSAGLPGRLGVHFYSRPLSPRGVESLQLPGSAPLPVGGWPIVSRRAH